MNELDELREDKARLDWCEAIAVAHPELVPMTRASIDAAMAEVRTAI